MVRLKSFDAFPKLQESYASPEHAAKPHLYLFAFVAILFLYLQTTTWMGGTTQFKFDVDGVIKDQLQINMQILVYTKCSSLGIYIQDISDDQLLVNELVKAIPHEDIVPGMEVCEIQGQFNTNRVRGRLAIQPFNTGFDPHRNLMNFNVSHYIYELSFGDFYPTIDNPLDYYGRIFDEPMIQNYHLKIVPTIYKAFGLEIDTNQYSFTQSTKAIKGFGTVPGIYFDYDIDPVRITQYDSRMSLFAWLCRVANIIGGVVFAFQASARLLKRKTSARYNHGLLDKPEKKS